MNAKRISSGIANDIKTIAAPKFQWDAGLKQADTMVKTLQKGKMEISDFFNNWKTGAQQIATQQARLANSTMTSLGNGNFQMYIPAAKNAKDLTSAVEMSNRALAAQGEMLNAVGTKIQDWGKNTQWAGRQLTVGFTMPFAIAAAAAGSYSLEIDKSLTRIEKVYDGSTKGLREMALSTATDITQTMGKTIKSSLDMMAELAAAGKQGKELQDLTKQAQQISVLGNVEQEASIKSLISMQSIFQMSTKDTADAVAYLNKVDADTPTSMQDLIDAIPIAGATVQALGGNLQDTVTLLTAFKEKGVSTTEGANAIKTSMARIIDPTKNASALFQQFTGKDLKKLVAETQGKPMETFQALSDAIIGSNIALKDQESIIQSLVGKYQAVRILDLLKGLQETNGAVAKTKAISDESPEQWSATMKQHLDAITQSSSGQFAIAVESFKAEMKSFGDVALTIFTAIIKGATKLFEVINGLPTPVKVVIAALLALPAIVGPLAMLAGIFLNMTGTVLKAGGGLLSLISGYKSLTIEQKANKLISDQLNKSYLTEADTAQILIYQMDKLVQAYSGVGNAATAAGAKMSSSGSIMTSQGYAIGQTKSGSLYVNDPKIGPRALNPAELAEVQQLKAIKDAEAASEAKVAEQTQKASKFQSVFKGESLLALSAVTAVGSSVAESGSGLEKWLNYISLASVGLYALLPVLSKIGTVIKGTSLVQGLLTSAGSVGSVVTNIVSKIGPAIGGALSALVSPVGLAISAALLGAYGIYKLINAASEAEVARMKAVTNSTDAWVDVLGKSKVTWGQIRDDAGNVKESVDSMVQKMREKNPAIVEEFQKKSGEDLNQSVRVEAYKLEGQGLSQNDIVNALNIALTAAGKKVDDIQKILADLKVHLDFSGGQQDLTSFINDMKKKTGDLGANVLKGFNFSGGDKWEASVNDIKQNFLDRLAGMNDVEKAAFSKKFVDGLNASFEDGFKDLNNKYGNKLGKSLEDSIGKNLTFLPGAGYNLNSQGMLLDMSARKKLLDYANTQYALAKAIGQTLNLNDDQIKSIRTLGDVLPYVTKQNLSAADIQKQYNKVVDQAKSSGQALTDEQKNQLAALYAAVGGLDANKLKMNEYAQATNNATDALQKNALGIQGVINDLHDIAAANSNASNATNDFWTSLATAGSDAAQAGAGFQSLGNNIQDQASKIVDSTKQIYTGTMSQIYDAFAAQANDQMQSRLDNIAKAYDAKKKALDDQGKAQDRAYTLQTRDFQDRWDSVMSSTKKSFDDRQKSIENSYQAQSDAIDAQIKQIQDQESAEKDLDDQRQREFEAQQKRMERLADLANRNIDYNRALSSGNLDEAARVQNNAMSVTTSWNIQDQQDAANLASDQRGKATKAQVDALNASKDVINKEKQAKLDALKEEQQAVEDSLNKQKEMQQRAMEDAREIEKDRLQNKIDSLNAEQQSVENAERKKQEMNKRTLDIELNTLKTFIPMNEQQLNEHIGRVENAYGQYGVQLTTSGDYWGKIIGGALQTNVDSARQQMAQSAAWSDFGNTVASAITQGAFGLNLGDFFNMIITGKPPANWTPPGTVRGQKHFNAYHSGGLAGSIGNRLGRTGDLYPDEFYAILQHGEAVLPRSSVNMLGQDNIQSLINGRIPAFHLGGLTGTSDSLASVLKGGQLSDYLSKGLSTLNSKGLNPNIVSGLPAGFGGLFGLMMGSMMRNIIGSTILTMGTMNVDSQGNYTPGLPVSGNVIDWIKEAISYAGVSESWIAGLQTIIARESGGNPNAINNWDINAQRGDPSRGLMQTIGSTFEHYRDRRLPDNIYDPVANIVAGINYIKAVYGDISRVQQANSNMPPLGYDYGGPLAPGMNMVWNGTRKVENVLNNDQSNRVIQALNSGSQVGFDKKALNKVISQQIGINNSLATIARPGDDSKIGNQYHYEIKIDGTDIPKSELKSMISDVIDDKHRKDKKRKGIIR